MTNKERKQRWDDREATFLKKIMANEDPKPMEYETILIPTIALKSEVSLSALFDRADQLVTSYAKGYMSDHICLYHDVVITRLKK